ncbi:hypothetical protein M422DRAFT_155671, partial [Sphaerobolus stellatus SS14]
PQHHQQWKMEVEASRRDALGKMNEAVKMLSLDVRTRCASTHQMYAGRALDYCQEITSYVAKIIPLCCYELNDGDWKAIEVVTTWLKTFRAATTQMSATKHSSLSSTHAVFKGLQDNLKDFLCKLPNTASPQIRQALVASHHKLSDYFYKFDQSPYPIWASLLDPRIGYIRLVDDHEEEPELRAYVDQRKKENEIDEFFCLTPELWDSCEPVSWWAARKLQFPNLSRLARDLLSIPGSAVAVECIFSGGRDTISLCRASLKPETIRTLMILKQSLRLART